MKVVVAAIVALGLFAPQAQEVGKEAPALKIKAVDGKEHDVAALSKEKVVAIVSWSIDCPSGKPTIPRSTAIANKFAGNEKVVFIGVSSYGDAEEKLAAYSKENDLKYVLACDKDKSIGKALGAKKVNSAYVFSGGKLFWFGGVTAKGDDAMDKAIEAALEGKPAPASGNKFAG